MARPLPNIHFTKLPFLHIPVTFFIIAISALSVLSIVTFLCGSHRSTRSPRHKSEQTTVRLGDSKPAVSKLHSSISSKALLMVKMISWRQVRDEEEVGGGGGDFDGGDDGEAVWRRTIIMGERCRPLEFSGKILYDSNGNPLPESPHPIQATVNSKPVSSAKS
ncbi:hypothetical protein RJ639_009725 [Escallonia herrerae]|uniref:Transmembrane protein n=1 Tax=Escallonia herrerae TaxID=1293975 RepID=A0AA88VNR0_9ASTE|nr:hypothetical protein RJ639_009725 [Escallonia herrerae]